MNIKESPLDRKRRKRAAARGRGYVSAEALETFRQMKLRSCKCFGRKRKLSDEDLLGHLDRMVRQHGDSILEPMERRVRAHLRGEPVPLTPGRAGQAVRAITGALTPGGKFRQRMAA